MDGRLFEDVDDGTRAAIMRATFEALCEHGYANLTIDRIGDSFPKSQSLLYHHYDGKDDLLRAFLDYLLDHHESDWPEAEDTSPDEQLRALLDHLIGGPDDAELSGFRKAMVELRAQASHDEDYRAHFTRSDEVFRERFESLIEAGIEAGEYDAVDAGEVATFLVTVLNGLVVETVTTDGADPDRTREAIATYLDQMLGRRTDR